MLIKFFHTNDIHCDYAFLERVAAYLKENRGADDFYFDSGDLADLKDLITQADEGSSLFELFAQLKPDGITLGNGEVDLGFEGVKRIAEFVPIIISNVTDNDGQAIPGLLDHQILKRGPYRFLVMGIAPYYRGNMTYNNYNVFSMMKNLCVKEPIAALRNLLKELAGQYDYSILLSHSGVVVEKNIWKATGVDIVLGGHSHEVYSEALYTQSGKAEYLGVLSVEVGANGLAEVSNEQIDIAGYSDEAFAQAYQAKKSYADELLSKELRILEELPFDPFGESRLTNFICDALHKEYGGDLALIHAGISEHSLCRPVSRKTLIENFPSKLNPTVYELRGSDLLAAWQLSKDQEHIHQSGKGPGFRGQVLGTLGFSANVTFEDETMYVSGAKVLADKRYRVVADDYLQRGYGYPSLKAPDAEAQFHIWFIRDLVQAYLEDPEVFVSSLWRREKK